ncbi:MAG: exo-alpha-sialidase [Verrucomicrobia subdivision 3 bacterium]|nr:exo-alpha-sialidase [Limisphaerales bacterium]
MTTLSRRQMLTTTAAAGFGFPFLLRAAGPKVKVASTRVISLRPDHYHGWPTLARRKNGELLLVCSGGRESHVCPFGQVELMRSGDDGDTWSFPRVLLDSPIDDRDAGVLETAKGSLLATTFTSNAYDEYYLKKGVQKKWSAEKRARWLGAHHRVSAAARNAELGNWMIRSTDGGVTWSPRYDSLVNSPHGPVNLNDGRVLYAGKNLWNKFRREKTWIGVCESKDDGQSWRRLAEIPTRNGDDAKNYHELHAVEAANGTLIAHIRNHNQKHHRETLQSESRDGGKTWTEPHTIGVWGLPTHLLQLKDSRLLMTYGYRRKPFGNQARVSADHGNTWSEPITLSADSPGGDLGYPSTVQLDNGSLVTVWYEKLAKSTFAVLRQARWNLA